MTTNHITLPRERVERVHDLLHNLIGVFIPSNDGAHAETAGVMRELRAALAAQQPPAQEAVIRHWSDCATNNRGVPEMLGPCDCGGYIPPAAPPSPPAQEARKPLTAAQMEAGRKAIFSTGNPFCPCDSKTFRKVSEWTERQHGIGESASLAKQVRP